MTKKYDATYFDFFNKVAKSKHFLLDKKYVRQLRQVRHVWLVRLIRLIRLIRQLR